MLPFVTDRPNTSWLITWEIPTHFMKTKHRCLKQKRSCHKQMPRRFFPLKGENCRTHQSACLFFPPFVASFLFSGPDEQIGPSAVSCQLVFRWKACGEREVARVIYFLRWSRTEMTWTHQIRAISFSAARFRSKETLIRYGLHHFTIDHTSLLRRRGAALMTSHPAQSYDYCPRIPTEPDRGRSRVFTRPGSQSIT